MKIFLIGFMGAGKTHWGRVWAEKSTFDFFDLDEQIEKRQHKTITEIFETEGEDHFRNYETEALQSFLDKDNFIIACGGGTPCFNDNMQWMNKNGTTVYLSASPQYIYDRVFREMDKRPLLKKMNKTELRSFIEKRLNERESIYKQAKLLLPVEDLNGESLQKLIIHNS